MPRWMSAILLLATWSSLAHAETRWAIAIGNNEGRASEGDLEYAESDARKVNALWRELGDVPPENAILLLGEDADTVRRAIVTVNDRIRQGDPSHSMLVVYYSGHADENALHLGDSSFELREFEALVRGSSASFRLVILDACRSGALTRVKGGVVGAPVPLAKVEVADRGLADGVVFFTASARDEDAQESDKIRGSFFTHYLVSGLRGAADADGDGDVDLDEAYRFAYERTLRASSGGSIGPQHPTFRHEMKGRSDVILTRVAATSGQVLLSFPSGTTWFVFAGSLDGALLAEVQSDAPRRVIALKAQRLFLRGRARSELLEATITPSAGERVVVDSIKMQRSDYARLVRKGGGLTSTNGLELGYRLTSALETSADAMDAVWLGFTHDREGFSVVGRLGLAFGSYLSRGDSSYDSTLSADTRHLELAFGLRKAFDLRGPTTFELGADLGVAWLHQSFDWVGSAPSRDSLGGRLAASAALVIGLPSALYVRVEGSAMLWLVEREDGSGADRIVPLFAPRFEFGLGWHL